MANERKTENVPPSKPQESEDPLVRVQKGMVELRKRLAEEINLDGVLEEDPEDFIKRFKQSSGE